MRIRQLPDFSDEADYKVFVARLDRNDSREDFQTIVDWSLTMFTMDQFNYSRIDREKGALEQTYWLMDLKSAMLFKLRWVGSEA